MSEVTVLLYNNCNVNISLSHPISNVVCELPCPGFCRVVVFLSPDRGVHPETELPGTTWLPRPPGRPGIRG